MWKDDSMQYMIDVVIVMLTEIFGICLQDDGTDKNSYYDQKGLMKSARQNKNQNVDIVNNRGD